MLGTPSSEVCSARFLTNKKSGAWLVSVWVAHCLPACVRASSAQTPVRLGLLPSRENALFPGRTDIHCGKLGVNAMIAPRISVDLLESLCEAKQRSVVRG